MHAYYLKDQVIKKCIKYKVKSPQLYLHQLIT